MACGLSIHYVNKPMQYTAVFFTAVKVDNFQIKKCDLFFSFYSKHKLSTPIRTALFLSQSTCILYRIRKII